MKQNLKKALTQNLGMKVLALVFAFFLWLVVVNIDDPKQTRTFTAVVTVTNEDVVAKSGKIYEIKNGVNTVSFRVTAKRSIIEKLSSADFTAVADMRYLEDEERVPVTITAKTYSSYITISSKQNYLYVVLEDEITSRFIIEAHTTGAQADGLVISSLQVTPNVITVTGREDVVTSIAKVTATCDVSGVSEDITESVIPQFFDGAGNEIDASGLQLSASTVDVSVDFESIKSVDIQVPTSGKLAEGLVLGSITTNPSSVLIKGQPASLNEVSAIVIPETVVNLSALTGSVSTTVDISAYLPEGVTLVDKAASKVTIYVNMLGEISKEMTVPLKNIRFANIPDGMSIEISQTTITVNVFGTEENLAALADDALTGQIDCSNLVAGDISAVLQFDAQPGISIQNIPVSVICTGTIKVEETTPTEPENNQDTTTDKTDTNKTDSNKTESNKTDSNKTDSTNKTEEKKED